MLLHFQPGGCRGWLQSLTPGARLCPAGSDGAGTAAAWASRARCGDGLGAPGGHRALAAPRDAGMGTAVAQPCPRRVPQRCAGTAGASDSSGGRARHGTGTAREDEPVQAWPQLVSPARLRCLIPSCGSAHSSHRLSHRAAAAGGGRHGVLPFHPHRPSQLVSGSIFNSETIADGFWSGAGAWQCPWC